MNYLLIEMLHSVLVEASKLKNKTTIFVFQTIYSIVIAGCNETVSYFSYYKSSIISLHHQLGLRQKDVKFKFHLKEELLLKHIKGTLFILQVSVIKTLCKIAKVGKPINFETLPIIGSKFLQHTTDKRTIEKKGKINVADGTLKRCVENSGECNLENAQQHQKKTGKLEKTTKYKGTTNCKFMLMKQKRLFQTANCYSFV